jgi:molybdopterin biosynthesis enzyme
MTGEPDAQTITLPLAASISQHPFLTQFLPAKLNSEGKAISLSPQNSGDFVTPLEGTGYLEIPPGDGEASSARFF